MDKTDRMLRALPQATASPELAARIQRTIHRRHQRRLLGRLGGALLLGGLGVWLTWPAVLWLSSGELYASGTAWLLGGLDYFNSESLDMVNRFLSGALTAQTSVGSAFAPSTWLGAIFVCCAIFLVMDWRVWQPVPRAPSGGQSSTILSSSVHV